MNTAPLSPRKALNKALLKVKPKRSEIELFKANLISLLDSIREDESEEFHKNLVIDFLKNTRYKDRHFINTKGRNDLVIHNGPKSDSAVGVIIEAKKPTNKAEMVSVGHLNRKALHELVLYYLRERITHKNLELKHLVITNINEWFMFDAVTFDRLFAQDKKLVDQFAKFESEQLSEIKTDFFYKQIAEPFIAALTTEIEYTHFNLQDYQKPLRNADNTDDTKLIALYKILSPEHLLKQPPANDGNTLNRHFYSELLHIIGLAEIKDKGKKLIKRAKEGERHSGSLLEAAIIQLDSLDNISRLPNRSQYGATTQDQLFNVALELTITWMNRILFLKLLEAQLLSYHKGDKSYSFLNRSKIADYDDLQKLFFQVLARQHEDRHDDVKTLFAKVPYLNSSLFEPTDIEHQTIMISGLSNGRNIPILTSTVLKTDQGKKRMGVMPTLDYLFAFLDAYDFSSEGSDEIQEDNKTLINASVLGLIFEKINGYKDGSFYTPSFITMYMCRETIRKAIVQKFNEVKGWTCASIVDVYNKIDDRCEANEIVNRITICDPAVGSGHFLVSALNELISVKSDLKILMDRDGKRLKEYKVDVVNDELIVTDEDREVFEYRPRNMESQRVQMALFHEKQTLIENCLFGVDINPNSVKICRLRLWIELLKNSYYKNETELETLPNIDINIKCGNSLVSRFELDADLRQALKKSRYSIDSYRVAVSTYRNASSKDEKREMERLIATIKSDFSSEITNNDPKVKRLGEIRSVLNALLYQTDMFGLSDKQKVVLKRKVDKFTTEFRNQEKLIEVTRSNKIFENAFEWRFEFPEVLNEQGDFVGFDVVIGNPPYMRVQEIQASQPAAKIYYEANYQNARAAYDLANLFFELAVNVCSSTATNAFIFPHKFFNAASSEVFRDYLTRGQYIDHIDHFGANMVFEDADTYTCVALFGKFHNDGFTIQKLPFGEDFKQKFLNRDGLTRLSYLQLREASLLYGGNQWIMFQEEIGVTLFEKIHQNSKRIADVLEGIYQGIATSKDDLYVVKVIDFEKFIVQVPLSGQQYQVERDLFKPFLMGKDVQRYSVLDSDTYVFFPYRIVDGVAEIITINEINTLYPMTGRYIFDHTSEFKSREGGKAGSMTHWHGYIYPKNLNRFDQVKLISMEICAKHPNVTLDENGFYHTTKAYSWVKKDSTTESYEYLLAIANSKLLWWFMKTTGDTLQGDARTFKTNYLNPFPLPETIDPSIEQAIADLVKLVLDAKKFDPDANTAEQEAVIDRLVYQLYGLTEEEIRIVEGVKMVLV